MRNRLTERDLSRIVKRVINEQDESSPLRCKQSILDYVKNNLFSEKSTTTSKIKLENNSSARIPTGLLNALFLTLDSQPTCWCKASDII